MIELPEVLKRLGMTIEQFRVARARLGLPKVDAFLGGPSADRPDDNSRPAWYWATIERWRTATAGVVGVLAPSGRATE